jgi:small conductance mechanosensitive channel
MAQSFIIKLTISFSIFIIFYLIASYFKNNYKKKTDKNLIHYEMGDILFYTIILLGSFFSLVNIGIQTASLFTIFGSIGLALALSLQGILTSIASGIYIGINELYQIGDSIQIIGPNGKVFTGVVKSFNMFNTTILDNNIPSIIPNTYIQNNIIQKIE